MPHDSCRAESLTHDYTNCSQVKSTKDIEEMIELLHYVGATSSSNRSESNGYEQSHSDRNEVVDHSNG